MHVVRVLPQALRLLSQVLGPQARLVGAGAQVVPAVRVNLLENVFFWY